MKLPLFSFVCSNLSKAFFPARSAKCTCCSEIELFSQKYVIYQFITLLLLRLINWKLFSGRSYMYISGRKQSSADAFYIIIWKKKINSLRFYVDCGEWDIIFNIIRWLWSELCIFCVHLDSDVQWIVFIQKDYLVPIAEDNLRYRSTTILKGKEHQTELIQRQGHFPRLLVRPWDSFQEYLSPFPWGPEKLKDP